MAYVGTPVESWDVQTVMMRNLPNKYTQQMLLTELQEEGFVGGADGAFDFLYLPVDMETNANKGYAFINFTSPEIAERFNNRFDGSKMKNFTSAKVVAVAPADMQGYEALQQKFANKRVSKGQESARPLFLRDAPTNKRNRIRSYEKPIPQMQGSAGLTAEQSHSRQGGAAGPVKVPPPKGVKVAPPKGAPGFAGGAGHAQQGGKHVPAPPRTAPPAHVLPTPHSLISQPQQAQQSQATSKLVFRPQPGQQRDLRLEAQQRLQQGQQKEPPPKDAPPGVFRPSQGRRGFLADLPQGDFLPQEEDLRDNILSYLAAWRSPEGQLATLWHLEADPRLQSVRASFMPPDVRFGDWIEHRIGGEIVLKPYVEGHFLVDVKGEAREAVQTRSKEMEAYFRDGKLPASMASNPQPIGPPPGLAEPAQPPSEVVAPVRQRLRMAIAKSPEDFENPEPMSYSDLERLMKRLEVDFPTGMVSNIGRKLGLTSPGAVIKQYCSDLVRLTKNKLTKAEKKEQQKRKQMADEAMEQKFYGNQSVDGEGQGRSKKQRTRNQKKNLGPRDAEFFIKLPGEMSDIELVIAGKFIEAVRAWSQAGKGKMPISEIQLTAEEERKELMAEVMGEENESLRFPINKWIQKRLDGEIVIQSNNGFKGDNILFSLGSGDDDSPPPQFPWCKIPEVDWIQVHKFSSDEEAAEKALNAQSFYTDEAKELREAGHDAVQIRQQLSTPQVQCFKAHLELAKELTTDPTKIDQLQSIIADVAEGKYASEYLEDCLVQYRVYQLYGGVDMRMEHCIKPREPKQGMTPIREVMETLVLPALLEATTTMRACPGKAYPPTYLVHYQIAQDEEQNDTIEDGEGEGS